MQPQNIKILIADDEEMFREGLKRLIDAQSGMRVVADVADLESAVRTARQAQPDVLLLDSALHPGGLEALAARLDVGAGPARVVVLTASEDGDSAVRALELGFYGIISRTSNSALFLRAIRSVAKGSYWLAGRDVADVVAALRQISKSAQAKRPSRYGLTPREMQVVQHLTDGHTNKGIAERCGIREDTVKHHLSHIFDKVGVDTRLELAMFALQHLRDVLHPL